MVQLAYYQHKLKQGYDANVKLRPLAKGDLVLRKVVGAAKNPAWGKLGPKWEGPYRITSMAGIGAYYLEDLEEKLYHDPGMYIILEDIIINEVFYSPVLGLLYYTSCVSNIYKYQTEP